MFENVQNFSEKNYDEDEDYKEMKQIFESFDKLSFEGDVHKFTTGKTCSKFCNFPNFFSLNFFVFFLDFPFYLFLFKLFFGHNKSS